VAKITRLNVQESADRTRRNYTKTAPAITPTTAAAMDPPKPLPMLLPGAPFPLKALGEADEEAPLEVPLETDESVGVTVAPEPVVDVPVGLVREPDDSEVEDEEVELVTVAAIEKPPLVP